MINDLGFYTVGTEKFYDKIPAMFRAQQLKQDLSWNFNDEVFSAIDWTQEPTSSLDELYAIRARQIREEYDYVLLFCSGGADSTNMFHAFVDNGLHVDEVVGSAPISGLRDWKHPDPTDQRAENTIEETFLTQIPWLHKIQQDYPRTKVTLHDYFDDMLSYKPDDWLLKGNDWMHPTMAGRYNLDRYLHLKRIAESGKKIAVVQGIDKPKVCRYRDQFYLVFYDNIYNNKYDSINHPNTNPVFFYHSPQLPQLIVKQAHVAAKFMMMPENKLIYDSMLLNDRRTTGEDVNLSTLVEKINPGVYERGIVPAIYPSINKISYQAGKPDKMFLGKHDHWFYQHHQGTHVWQMMQSDLENLVNSIDKKFLMFNPYRGLLGFKYYRKYYLLGNVSNFTPANSIIAPVRAPYQQEIIITLDSLS
jgi:hypothetical protein